MKSIGKFLLLVIVIVSIGFIGWQLLQRSLFSDNSEITASIEQNNVPSTEQSEGPAQPDVVSDEQAFNSTNADASADGQSDDATFSCDTATEVIGDLYQQYMSGSTKGQLHDWLQNNPEVPNSQLKSFNRFVQSLSSTPRAELPKQEKVMNNFKEQCQAQEKQ